MMKDIIRKKAELRRDLRALRRELSEEIRNNAALCVRDKLVGLPQMNKAKVALAYMPMKYELDVLPAVQALVSMGKNVAFPLCTAENGLRFFVPTNDNSFVEGAYGILEPCPERCIEVFAEGLDAIILPGIGFDNKCNRLGQGGGYYDRLLARTSCFTVGVGFDCQLVENIPTEDTDKRVDAVVLASKVFVKQ